MNLDNSDCKTLHLSEEPDIKKPKLDLGDVGNTMDDESSSDNEVVRIRKKKAVRRKIKLVEESTDSEGGLEAVEKKKIVENVQSDNEEGSILYQNQEDDPRNQFLFLSHTDDETNGNAFKVGYLRKIYVIYIYW